MSLFDIFKGKSAYTKEEEQQRQHAEAQTQQEGAKVTDYKAPQQSDRGLDTREPEKISEESTAKAELAKEKLETILRLSDLGGTVIIAYYDNAKVELNISDTEELGRIIGKDGVAINALQTLVRQFIYQEFKSGMRVQIDAADYKRKREQILKKESEEAADKIRMGIEERVELTEMNASERRYVHGLFEEDRKVKSYSAGEGRRRHVILEKQG